MQKPTIKHPNRRHYVAESRSFGQPWFRRKNGLDPKFGLCAALVQLWWASVREGKDGIELLKNASSQLVEDIVNRQLRSYYFGKIPNETELDEETAFWLNAKYGTTDLREIRVLCEKYGVDDLLELDLTLEHQAIIVAKQSSSSLTPDFLDAFALPSEPGLRLLLLRYSHPGHRGGQSGHRMALAADSNGGCKFFDPNWGEMTFKALQDFRAWFVEFWKTCKYKSGIERPVPNILPFRLYRFSLDFAVDKDLLITAGASTIKVSGKAFSSSENEV
jgi:hypothetical protein